MFKKMLSVALVMSITLMLAGCDVLAMKKGQKFTRKVTMNSSFSMTIFSNVDDEKALMILNCQVTDIDKDGNAIVLVSIDKIESSINTMGLLFQFSTDKPEVNTKENSRPEIQKGYVEIFSSLVGRTYTAVVDTKGKVLELKDIAPEIKRYSDQITDDKITGRNQAIMLLSSAKLKEYVSPAVYNGIPDKAVGSEMPGYEVVVPSVPALPVLRKIVDAGNMAQATADWADGVDKYYYSVRCEGLPGIPDPNQVQPAQIDAKFSSATHSAASVYGNGCAGFSKEGFYKFVERIIVEVKSSRLGNEPNTGENRRKIRMAYTVDTIVENVD